MADVYDYNKAEKSNPEKKSKEFDSPANTGGLPYGRTKMPKNPATPKDPLSYIEGVSKADEDNHHNG